MKNSVKLYFFKVQWHRLNTETKTLMTDIEIFKIESYNFKDALEMLGLKLKLEDKNQYSPKILNFGCTNKL